MSHDLETPDATAITTRRAVVEGPVAERDMTLSGEYVAGHDLHLTVHHHGSHPDAEPLPFLVVDREYLEEQARKPKRVYVARSPDWADVVHGTDPELRFIERDQTQTLHAAVRDELLAPITRGTDRQLHSLFVLGAPGSGKTTLVRRVAAMLVLAGECVVADFGVKIQRVSAGEAAAYIRALDRLAAEGMPVLVLLDDPFFANSGWVELLQALGKPQHQGIAVLGASPDFLFRRFGHRLFGKQVLGRTFDVSRPSEAERTQLALLHHRDPATSLTADEDLLVVAMEAAAGESFRDIMQRIWMTLNDGVAVDPATDVRHLPWQVVAYAVICYFHRNYVLCPESLLHEFLTNTLEETPPSYLAQELEDLVTEEGWRIFSVHTPGHGRDGRLIGATHARVAREAFPHRPRHGLDVEQGVIDASVRVPAGARQVAELILVHNLSQANKLAKRFAARWSTAIADRDTQTRTVCALVRALKSSRAARLHFRGVLRKCLTAQDDQSWLAAWQLYHMSDESHPQEREMLIKYSLPWTLNIADFSAGPSESIEIAERMGRDFKKTIVERLTQSLRGELAWKADARQVTWLLGDRPAAQAVALLEPVYSWLEDDLLTADDGPPSRAQLVVEALVPMLTTDGLLDDKERTRLLGVVFDWLLVTPVVNDRVLLALLDVAETAVDEQLLIQLFEWLCTHSESNEPMWRSFLAMLGRLPGAAELVRQVVPGAFDWLNQHPENNESAWAALFALLGRIPEVADVALEIVPAALDRLLRSAENNESAWSAFLTMVSRLPGAADIAREIVPQAFDWLRQRPENNESAWGSLLSLLGRVPELADLAFQILPAALDRLLREAENNETAWAALLSSVWRIPGSAELARQIVPQAFDWLRQRPENNESAWGSLFSVLGRVPELSDLAREILPQAFVWLQRRPEHNETAWGALFSVLGRASELSDLARGIVPEALELLLNGPENNETVWNAFLTMLGRLPDAAGLAGEVVSQSLAWLKERSENNAAVWRVMLHVLARAPELTQRAQEIVPQAFAWLMRRPETNSNVWVALLSAIWRVPGMAGLARTIVPAAFARLSQGPESNEWAWGSLFTALGRIPELADLAPELVPAAFERLRNRPESNEAVWSAFLTMLGRLPGAADISRAIVPAAFDWLKARPEHNETAWAALLAVLGRVPGLAEPAREILPAVFAWLRDRPGSSRGAWPGLVVALSAPIDLAPGQRTEMLATLRAWSRASTLQESSHVLRGLHLLELVEEGDPELVPTVEAELAYLEDNPRLSLHTLAPPLSYAITSIGRADLLERLAAWERRSLDGYGPDGEAEALLGEPEPVA